MTYAEFNDGFEVLYNNIMSNAAPGLNGYEKSLFLTKAQHDTVIDIYNGTYNGDSAESTEEVRRYIDALIKDYSTVDQIPDLKGVSLKSVFYSIPTDVWFRMYESVTFDDLILGCKNNQTDVIVKPITHDEYHTVKKNPFRQQNDRRVLRLDYSNTVVELISSFNIAQYYLRYISHPSPIIVENLSDYDLEIDGETQPQTCKLNPVIHQAILERAVNLAKQSWIGNSQS